ncbi:MAG: hypothetical protein KA472_18270 [Pseudomonadales bacterium]|jgi:hypothetical protein|nr:hypothetical protein [Pseudomonadales bacterium]
MRILQVPRAMLAVALCCLAAAGPALGAGAFQQLDIGLVAFDPGIPEDIERNPSPGIFPEVRRAEANYLPFVLRQTLVASDNWGVVRVLPAPDTSAELLISGTIVRSDGMVLEIALKALDCTGREWLNKTYKATTSEQDFSSARNSSKPLFAFLYRQIEDDLRNKATELGASEIGRIEQVSKLLYARSLVPDAFAGHLEKNALGIWELQRLPAANDPLMERIERVREHEYLFVDAVDEQYAELYDRMTPSYDMWRKIIREESFYQESRTEQLKSKDKRHLDAYESMKQSYNAYKWSKVEQQEVAMLASGLNNELSPTLLEIEGRLVSLDGSLQQRYEEWRRILYRMFELDRAQQ